MQEAYDTLLITSAIAPSPQTFKLRLTDPAERALQTVAACLGWTQYPWLRRVVICDGTGSEQVLRPLVPLFEEHGIALELLGFQQDAGLVEAFGKGYGEGAIIAYAISRSRLLADAPSFYKVTGRLFVKEFSHLPAYGGAQLPTFALEFGRARQVLLSLVHKTLPPSALRVLPRRIREIVNPGVSTVFWHSPRDYFLRFLQDAYLGANDRERCFVEYAVLPRLLKNGVRRFQSKICVVGESGTRDRSYSGGVLPAHWLRAAHELLA